MKQSDQFFAQSIRTIFQAGNSVVDIGGGLRISSDRGNRYDEKNDWIRELAKAVDYKIMDLSDTYHPDIVGDIHHMPFPDKALNAVVCISVLEHVEDPIRAAEELHRVLQPGGYCFVYVPFLYYYHAEPGYYGDFWRFTEDSIKFMFKEFSEIAVHQTTGAIEMWVKISPLGRLLALRRLARFIDRVSGKSKSKQTSGYNVFLVK